MSRLLAGTAKVCISPTPEMFPYPGPSYMGPGVKVEGIYQDIFVRALVLDNGLDRFLLVSFEESNGTDVLKEKITETYGIPGDHQILCQIHNHGGAECSAITKDGRGNPHKGDQPVQQELAQRIFDLALEAVGEAIENLRPVKWGYGEGRSYLNVNRDLPNDDGYFTQGEYYDGPSDKTLAVLKLVDDDGNLVAAVLNYCAHAVMTMGARDVDGKMKVSGDFPGFTCDWLEKKNPGAVVLWTSGAAGDQNAIMVYSGEKHYKEVLNGNPVHIPPGYQYHYAQYMGERHAVDAQKVLRRIDCHRSSMEIRTAVTDVMIPQQRPPRNVNFWVNVMMAQNNVTVLERMAPEMVVDGEIVGRKLVECEPTGTSLPCEVQMVVLGDLAIFGVSAELYNRLGSIMKAASPLKNSFVITVTGGHGDRVGYIQDTESNAHQTFQHFGEAYPCDSNSLFREGVQYLTDQIFCSESE